MRAKRNTFIAPLPAPPPKKKWNTRTQIWTFWITLSLIIVNEQYFLHHTSFKNALIFLHICIFHILIYPVSEGLVSVFVCSFSKGLEFETRVNIRNRWFENVDLKIVGSNRHTKFSDYTLIDYPWLGPPINTDPLYWIDFCESR